MFTEQINSNPQLGLPHNPKANTPGILSPIEDLRDLGTGTREFRIPASGKLVIPLRDILSAALNDNGEVTIQMSAAPTVCRVTSIPATEVYAEARRVTAGQAATTSPMWDAQTIAAGDIVALPVNVSGIYIEAAAGTYGVIRRP